mgnify:CR=1 FL=1
MADRPALLLHICCAPDEAWVVKSLGEQYDLHCFFCNPNIYPYEEYVKRRDEASRVAAMFGVSFSCAPNDNERWEAATAQFQDTPEGGQRCEACFLFRLRATAAFCAQKGLPSFTSVMSVSPHKRIALLNSTGAAAAAEYGVSYLPFDFKKKGGFLGSVRLSEELGIYRQDYCGCRLSRQERDARQLRRAHAGAKPH